MHLDKKKHMYHLNNVGYNGIMTNGNIIQFLLIFHNVEISKFHK